MNIFKKIWNFLFGKKEEEALVLETPAEEVGKKAINHCGSHTRFRKNCPDCLRVIALI
jgi:hypothetical protein